MPVSHVLLAVLVAMIWGLNFLFVGVALQSFPPVLLCALRFLFASFPALLFVRPPKAPFRQVAVYGLVMFGLQFGLLFVGMHMGMPVGLASLLMQVQVFFSLIFAAVFLGERSGFFQITGALVAFSGIALVALHIDSHVTLAGFLCILASAGVWGVGNLLGKGLGRVNIIALIVWGSAVACVPMFLLSWWLEGAGSMVQAFESLNAAGTASLFYIVYVSTWAGYGIWNYLLARYPVGMVAPFTLLVPVVGILSAMAFFREPMYAWKWMACVLVMAGLCIHLFGARLLGVKTEPAANPAG